jgi:magnesium transporter
MLSVYVQRGSSLEKVPIQAGSAVPEDAIWIDLVAPTHGEDKLVEQALGIAVPTREEMLEIEVTSRLYIENGARYMTATLMYNSDTDSPKTTAITFILAGHRLITVRYDEPRPFTIVSNKLSRACPPNLTGETVMMDILDAVIDRAADILERIGGHVDQVSTDIFETANTGIMRARPYTSTFVDIGRNGSLTSKVRESLVSVGRLVLYVANEADVMKWPKDQRAMLKGMQRDVASLSDHATYLSNKIQFLLDAMLGVVNLQQNNIIKIFSVAAVVFMPPTLVASIYGMNFHHNMPELEWEYGYPFALILMVMAAVVPYVFFKWRKWL